MAQDLKTVIFNDIDVQRWKSNEIVQRVEAARAKFLASTEIVADMPGNAGPFDQQPISKAARGSKNQANCIRLCHAAYRFGHSGVVELGTNLGISSAYLAIGARVANAGALVVTGDCSGKRLMLARAMHVSCNIKDINYVEGYFENTIDHIIDCAPSWGLAFVDGDHTYAGTLRYYSILKARASKGSIIIFDDIEWSDGMRDAWRDISSERNGDVFSLDGVGYLRVEN